MIEINGLTKVYGTKCVVDNVTFTVEEGEIVGFLGPNGAGKSTTMNMLTGYLSATSGSAKIDGIDILENPTAAKAKIGFLPEQPPLYLDMTVKEYLDFVYELKKCTLNRKKHIEEICSVVKIDNVYNRLIKQLSKGYRQRVGIAQALIGNPPVLIFDEPTVGLDPKQIIEIRNLIKGLGKHHTVILSSHILPEVQAVCDRIVVINKGKLVANQKTEAISNVDGAVQRLNIKIAGPVGEVLEVLKKTQGVAYAELLNQNREYGSFLVESEKNADVRKPVFFALCEKKYPIMELSAMGANLEDVFISLIKEGEEK